MYKKVKQPSTSLQHNESYEGETIEQKIDRILNNKEPITDGAPLIYSDRKDGVRPEYDIRTDRWDLALDAMDLVTKDHRAKREARILKMDEEKLKGEGGKTGTNDGGAESIQPTV